jgi:membrane protease YdiL (CAAX protease family)
MPTPLLPAHVSSRTEWRRLLLGLAAVFALFHASALALGSDRGQAGLLVGALVVGATLVAERLAFATPPSRAVATLGLGRPQGRSLMVCSGLCIALLLVVPLFARATGSTAAFRPGWPWLLPGLFAQAGVAEEVLFRGYLFGHLRRGRSFWRAASLSMLPFVAVHTILFLTMAWPVALAALVLSVVTSFPMAHLFELGARTIWAPALLHFTVQGTIKVLDITGGTSSLFPLVCMVAAGLIPLLAFLAANPDSGNPG